MKTAFFTSFLFFSFFVSYASLPAKITEQPPQDNEYAEYWIVIADTSLSYADLHAVLLRLHERSGLEIDTMNRYYNTERDQLILKEDDPDELYRGEYFPRRFPSETLSIEYLDFYDGAGNDKTMACVAGIFERQRRAKRLVRKWRKEFPHLHTVHARVYIGCMH